MRKLADTPISLRLTGAIWLMLLFAWGGMIVWETRVNRETAIDQAQDFARSIHEMTMAGLTGMMITGTVGQREVFLDQIKQLSVIKDLEVIRGEGVSRQYGPGNRPIPQLDADEREALERRAEVLRVERDPLAGEYLRVVMPALASENYLGKNCIACHQVPAGTPLGLVSMKVSLDKVNAAVDTFMWKSIVSALVVSLPLIAFVVFFVRRFVVGPLTEMNASLAEIAKGEGDLTRRLQVAGRDEIGQTAATFNAMLATIAQLVRQVGESAGQVTSSARQLSSGAVQVADGSRRQNEHSGQVAAAVENVAEGIASVAASAERVHGRSQESLRRSGEGAQTLVRLVAEVDQAEAAVRQMADSVEHFVDSSTSITTMTQEVREIAEQTNLLALNAAIEAARAGESGRGFAVVADEVRKLAERTAQSTGEISTTIDAIVLETERAVQGMHTLSQRMGEGVGSARTAGEVLATMDTNAALTLERIRQIAESTREQSAASNEIVSMVESIASGSSAIAQSAGRNAGQAQSLQRLSGELQSMLARFKV